MKKYINTYRLTTILSICLIWLSTSSCESLIEIDLPTNQINSQEVFKDISIARNALTGLYTNVREESLFTGKISGMGTLLSLYTDELTSNVEANSKIGINEFYTNTLLPSNNQLALVWNNSYKHIYSINSFIYGLTNSKYIDEQSKKPLLAQAYFLRALYYHYLCQLFGDIPYVTSIDYNTNTKIKKTTYIEVLNLIEADLLNAIDFIEIEFHKNKYYPNKSNALLLLAKNYLLKKDYIKAEITAKELLSIPNIKIEKDPLKTFKKNASSTLWQLDKNSPTTYTYEADNFSFKTFPPSLTLSNHILSIFTNDDLRKSAWINKVNKNNLTLYHSYKYKNINNNTDENSIVFRIEEAYFILAEAYIYQDKPQLAIQILNTIKQRANTNTLSENLDKQQIITELLKELQKEFFTEQGHRFFDLKRNGKLSLLESTKPNWSMKNSLLPIPEKELLLNPNLLPQNNGY
ncbi:RagB/SusD family nutrient uptake outer membrane protein [Myroides odoratimimus]|uniref:RagB/SusD family nutrient uptake outer membrane protein n=1 Tax=Myroides odoratimimus TaxID=76832 RepID=UPI002DB7762B|nr:RagB/SusD family nutrient uptake outer membrane protein [Myroides odoratimimus]MEC4036812.1 RagB/SusD family nutrient uptake outer membrane protein [Myroides odoratimimus]